MHRRFLVPSTVLALLGLILANVVATAAPSSQTPATLRLYAGDGEGVVAMNDFRMPTVRVEQGTTVTWVGGSDEPHTVTFLAGRPIPAIVVPQPEEGRPPMFNPEVFFPAPATGPWDGTTYVNSAFLEKSQEFSITFGRQDRYEYLCLLHPPMTGVVEVVAPGSTGTTTQTAVDEYHRTHTQTVHMPQVARLQATRGATQSFEGAAGSRVYVARAGTEWRYGHLEMNAFFPAALTIRQGDTVVWYSDSPTAPHTVTFPVAGQSPPEFVVPTLPDGTIITGPPPEAPAGGPPPDASMLPRLVLGPGTVPARPSPTHDGRSVFGSGIFGDLSPTGMSSWALTFDAVGTFNYICIVHPGMEGTVTVQAR